MHAGGAPLQSLFGFERVTLQPGQNVTLTFPATAHTLSLADQQGARQPALGTWRLTVGELRQDVECVCDWSVRGAVVGCR